MKHAGEMMMNLPGFGFSESIQNPYYEGTNTHVYRALRTSDNQPVILKKIVGAHLEKQVETGIEKEVDFADIVGGASHHIAGGLDNT